MRVLKILGLVLLGLVTLAGVAVAAFLWRGDALVASLIEGRGSAMLGREIRIGGAFEIDWGSPIRIVAEDVHVANAEWGSGPEMFASRRLELDIEPWPLLRFKYVVPRLALDGTKVLLETNEAGEGNWQFFAAKAATPQERSGFPDLHKLEVTDSSFTWKNGQTGATTEIGFEELAFDAPSRDSEVKLAAAGSFQKKPYRLDATLGPLAQLQDKGTPYPAKIDGEIGGTKVAIDGTLAEPLDFEGLDSRVVLEGKDLQQFLDVFSIPVPSTPPFRIAGQLTHSGDKWSGEKVEAKLGKSALAGGIAIDVSGKKPYIKAQLVSKYLDLADFKGFTGQEAEEPPQKEAADKAKRKEGGRVIPETPLPTEQLAGFDADISIDAAQIKPTGGVPFERVTLVLALKDRDLWLKPLRFGMANGEVAANLHWNARKQPGVLEAEIDLRRFDLAKFFAGMDVPQQVKNTTSGIVGGFVKLKSQGGNQREVVANADGEIGIFMQNGSFSQLFTEVIDLDIAESLSFLLSGDKPNPINCLASRFEVVDGVATVTTFIIDTKDTVLDARGNINLGAETIYLDLYQHPKDWSPLSVRAPIEIRGTLGDPEAKPRTSTIVGRVGAAVAAAIAFPPAALLPLIDVGLGEQNMCRQAFAAIEQTRQQGQQGSSAPPPRRQQQQPQRRQ